MTDQLINDRDIDFLLYELLDTEQLLSRERYQEHSREVFNATLDTARTIATKYFANHNAKGDANEPRFDGERVHMIEETQAAWDAFAEAGFLAAHADFDEGGLQMPEIILRSAMAYISAANVSSSGYPFLTIGAANLIRTFGSEEQKALYLPPMQDGRFAGTMALTEPGQGSALADITTTARPQADGSYRLYGQKMFISGGDQSLTENIVHMVLAKIEGAPAGAKGISLFICPKVLVNADGSLGARNDVALAGLLHKMGYRNTTSTVLSFGEQEGAQAWLVGEPHKGLGYMFQMMNEARIGVGMGAAILGYQGYNHSLDYARNRPQGRLPSNRDPSSKQVPIIQHADVRRMLLAQKAYCEGSLALCFYASALYEDSHTAPTAEEREQAFALLDLLTPMVKSFPSRYGLKANELAIQVLGGSGYTREYPLEQYYRDNRLNPIHEGTEAIHGLDLLGRKVPMAQMAAYRLFTETAHRDLESARAHPELAPLADAVAEGLTLLNETTATLLSRLAADPDRTLANATVYLDMFGRVLVAWIWIKQALVATGGLANSPADSDDAHFYQGKLQAARYFINWELPEIKPQAELLQRFAPEPFEMQDAWF
ncbi:acyl-CoA dehydrogenase [Aestuariirhabdus litorea]|uniref:Acyl-CoA dehydrogenase n=1 Tax=Aestuariirhabdus litorea TaxID=2528527 RepID=A0A3P3VM15_9GAMM|nr:acyl-CoA dehydrogenase [Aestuariirhabdus litorea]RRJ83802.1 acyl-CoA dehydrogenase [Aestuariirhabdus litorea]RWW97025.1 acyl-CoA dehydrogenase [Endozoicomonadaceae bacterium GTF-13]